MEFLKKLNVLLLMLAVYTNGLPVLESAEGKIDQPTLEDLRASINETHPKNLYIVKAVTYEVSLLTEGDSNETDSPETRERVDLTFFDAHTNNSHIDLGSIPLPVQSNVSGQVLTGIVPIAIGGFSDPRDILSTLPITGTIANITHSNTALFQITTSNQSQELSNPNENILTPEDIAEIPEVGDVFPEVKHHPEKIRNEK
ncbi:hypothetical protein ACFFRR_011594 [Megaselia abdita]